MVKRTVISRLILFSCCVVPAVWLTAAPATGQHSRKSAKPVTQAAVAQNPFQWWVPNPEPRISIRSVLNFSDLSVVPASGAILVRTRDNVFTTMHTAGLPPGAAVTFWWVFFNNPHNCATRPCGPADLANPAVAGSVANAGGKIIGADGAATFGAFRRVGDTTSVVPGFGTGQGLLNPLRAEIFLVTRSHGSALTGDQAMPSQQLTMYNGGCPPNTCVDLQVSVHQP
jgi:hypothetical protein